MIVKRIGLEARKYLQREKVMAIAMVLAAITSLINPPQMEYINHQVLSLLFCLMVVISGFKKLRLLDYGALKLLDKCKDFRQVSLALVGITFISSMFITNDVALLTFVPLALAVGQTLNRDMVKLIIWQTLAANLGSAFTPMGNPQNLFLYSFYDLEPMTFLRVMLPLTAISLVWLLYLIFKGENYPLDLELPLVKVDWGIKLYVFIFLFVVNLLSVFRVVDFKIALLFTLTGVALVRPKLFRYVDYSLLLTFIGFFIFVGNISHWNVVLSVKNIFLGSELGVYITGIFLSQFISNVPAAMLLSGFTNETKALLLGVNVGGLGTLIASMASVISYKLYMENNKQVNNQYLRQFIFYNCVGLIGIGLLVWFIW